MAGRLGQLAQSRGELRAVGAGHVDVEQHQVALVARRSRPAPGRCCPPRRPRAPWARRIRPPGCAGAGGPALRRRRREPSAHPCTAAPRSARETHRAPGGSRTARPRRASGAGARAHCAARCRCRAARRCLGKVLTMLTTACARFTRVRMRITPPSGAGSTPWRTAFSTSGCSRSGGTRAAPASSSSSQLTCRRSPKRTCSMAR